MKAVAGGGREGQRGAERVGRRSRRRQEEGREGQRRFEDTSTGREALLIAPSVAFEYGHVRYGMVRGQVRSGREGRSGKATSCPFEGLSGT